MTLSYGLATALGIVLAVAVILAARLVHRGSAMRQRYERVILSAQVGLFDWDVSKDEYYASPRLLEIVGLPPDAAVIGRAEFMRRAAYHPEDRDRWERAVRELFASGGSRLTMDLRLIRNGKTVWTQSDGVCFRDAKGRVVRWTGSVTDITERKQAETALRSSEQRYALAMEAASDGITDWDLQTGEFYISPRLLAIIGHPSDARFSGRDDWVRRFPFHPDDRKRWEAAIAAHFAGTEAKFKMDLRIVVNGETRWVAFTFIATRDATGKVVRWTGSIADINDAKRDVAAVLDAIPGLVAILAPSGEVDAVNSQLIAHCGQPLEGMKQWGTNGIVHADDLPRIAPAFTQAISAGEPYAFEARIRRFDGTYGWHEVRGLPFRDANDQIVRWYVLLTDTDARARAEEELRLSEERYALAMRASGEGHWDWKIATDEFYASPRYLELAGLPPDFKFSRRDDIVPLVPFHPDDRAPYEAAVAAHFAGETPRVDMVVRVVPHGELRWLHVIGMCSRDADGAPVRWAGSVNDITARKCAEEALRESEKRYERVMLAAEAGFWDWNVPEDEFYASPKLLEMADLPGGTHISGREDFISRARFHPDDRSKWKHAVKDLFADGGSHLAMEVRFFHGAETRWALLSGMCVRDEAGKIVRWTGSSTNITDRKKAADELRESEARFRGLTALWSDWYWRQDEHLRFTYSSAADDPPPGHPGGSAIGKTRWELPGIVPLSGNWMEHKKLLAARRPFRDFEYSRPAPDGTLRYISTSGTPLFDENGAFSGYHGVGRDITDRKRAEEELRSRQQMLDLAQKAARAIAFEWKIGAAEGENRWSPELEAMYGIPAGTYDGSYEAWKRLVHPEDWTEVQAGISTALVSGDVDIEYRVVHTGGKVLWLQAKGRMLLDSRGKPARVVGFMFDVTDRHAAQEELQQMEQQLRQAQRLEALGTLAGGIAHDFNNILGAIIGYGEMAMRGVKKDTRLYRDLDTMMAASERGRALVDRILAFSRSGVGESTPVHVEGVVREALDQVAARLPPNITIHPRLHAGRAAMLGDSTQVHQVVMNLASNAVQAMPRGGMLRVELVTEHVNAARPATVGSIEAREYIVLKISDTGTGIAPEVLERMFDPFFTTKGVGVGTGLGLSLVHGIVTSVGGAIDVTSELGRGSTFTVHFPRAGDAALGSVEEDRPLPKGDGQRVLVVDDEEPLMRLASQTLSELGYATTGFTSSIAALDAFRADPARFDAVLTDERMPGMSGSTLIREVRGIRRAIPVVLMSGYLGVQSVDADIVVRKPLSMRDLATSMARALEP